MSHEIILKTFNYKPKLEELERINQEMQENYVFENRAARYSMESLRVGWESLLTSINRTINECEDQVDLCVCKLCYKILSLLKSRFGGNFQRSQLKVNEGNFGNL